MAEPIDMIVPMLREMRQESLAEHEKTRGLLTALDSRLGKIEVAQASYRNALSADTLMSKLITGEFEERIGALEARVRDLESHK